MKGSYMKSGSDYKKPTTSQTKKPKGSSRPKSMAGSGGGKLGRFAGGSSQVKKPVGTSKC